jgi:MFS family permease
MSIELEKIPLLNKQSQGKFKKYSIEPTILIFFFGCFLAETIVPSEVLKLICYKNHENQTICENLARDNAENILSESLQQEAAQIFMTTTIFSKVLPAIATFFIMPWSDRYGRKIIFLLSFFGSSASFLLMYLNAIKGKDASPWNYAFAHIPNALVGASSTKSTIIFSYITDVSTKLEKSTRLVIAEIVISMGSFTGMMASSYIFKLTNAESVFLISLFCSIISCFFVFAFVDESLKKQEEISISKCEKISHLFSLKPASEMKKTIRKVRNLNENEILWKLIIIQMLVYFIMDGTNSIFYLFTVTNFNWTLKDFSLYNSTITFLTVFGNLYGILVFKNLFKFSDGSLLILSTISRVFDSLFKTFANTTMQMYLISTVCLLKGLLSSMNRSLLSSFIPQNEIGKVFTILSFSESVAGFIASPAFTYIYINTYNYFSGAFYIISTAFEVLIFILTVSVINLLAERRRVINFITLNPNILRQKNLIS